MELINNISEQTSYVPKIVNEIKAQSLPLLFYGAGQTAEYYYTRLIDNKIAIDSVIVDDQYHCSNTFFQHYRIQNFSTALKNNKKFNIFIAFATKNLELLKKNLLATKKVNKIYYLDDPAIFNGSNESYYYSDIIKHLTEYNKFYTQLSDNHSKNVMVSFINQRISEKRGFLDDCWTEDDYNPNGVFNYSNNEVFIDCGAYDGDTVQLFIKNIQLSGGNYKKLIAIEPDKRNFEKLKKIESNIENVQCINKGVWHSKTTLQFNQSGTMSSAISTKKGFSIDTDTIDNILNMEKASFIKMDIEGSELHALTGAKETIINHKPKLAICVYHKNNDLITIPQYIKSLVPEYRFYLRAHRPYTQELVLYATL